ncbi:MAG: hypothetical protein GEU74_12055 [Nitriliruptorales bacterium]|nr:hypothetical protein [Nitriliruptorales bacterium]
MTLEEITPRGRIRNSFDVPIPRAIDGARLRVAADGSAALVELRDNGEPAAWLLVDDLNTPSPRTRTITDVKGRLVLLDDPSTRRP